MVFSTRLYNFWERYGLLHFYALSSETHALYIGAIQYFFPFSEQINAKMDPSHFSTRRWLPCTSVAKALMLVLLSQDPT